METVALKVGDSVHVPAANAPFFQQAVPKVTDVDRQYFGPVSSLAETVLYNRLVVQHVRAVRGGKRWVVCCFDTPGGAVEGPEEAFVKGWPVATKEENHA